MTKRLLSVFTLLMMLMMTSLSAHAVSYYLAGDFTNWENGKIEMASDGQGQWVVPAQAVTAGQQFKIIKVDGETTTWYGYNSYHVNDYVVQHGTVIDVYTDNGNLDFQISGIFRFVLTENGNHPSLIISYVPQPVTVKSDIANGTVTVDPAQALPGETITITATPDPGYYVEVGNIKVEKTINGGSAQAPGLKADGPGIGQFVTDIQVGEAPNTFTFAMPESPFGAKVSAEFQACIPITAAMIQPNPIPDQDYTGSQIKPAIVVKDGETTLIEGTDYTLEYGANVDPGEGTIIVTGKGKYTGTVKLTFTIKQGVHNVNITTDGNGQVTAEPTSGVQGTPILLTITPNEGYELDKLSVGGTEVTVTGNTYTFSMPDADVAVNATFKKVDYTITVTSNEYGTVTVNDNKTTANFGDNITLTIAPNEDCVLQELKVDGQVVEVVGNTYTFTMPSHNVAVEATFRALEVSYQVNYGKGNPWAQVNEIALVKGTDGKWTAADKEIPAEYEAVLVKKVEGQSDVLLGTLANGDYWITANYLANPVELPMSNIDADHHNLYFPNAGIYNFSYDPAEKKLVVTGDFIYTITVTNPATEVTVDKTTAKAGETVTINVVSIPEGNEIDAVKVNDGAVEVTLDEETGKYTFAMPAGNATVTVTFKAKAYELTVTSNEYGKVTVKDKELVENKTTAAFEESITLNIAANENCVLDKLMVDGVDVTSQVANNTYTFSMPSHNVAVEATFRALTVTYEIHWGKTPEGSTSWAEDHVIPMTKRDDGGWVAINQVMEDGAEFKVVKKVQDGNNAPVLTWYGAQANGMYWITADNLGHEIQLGSEAGYNNLYFPDGGNYTFNFNPINNRLAVTGSVLYDITYSVGPGGTVTADKTQAVCQEIVTVTVTPNPGYEIDELKYTFEVRLPDGTPTGSHATYPIENGQFSMPASDVTITATFKLKDYTITLLGGQPAHATVTVPATAHLGEEVTVTVEPDPGYEVEEMRYAFTAAPEGTGGQGVHVDYPIENGKFTMPAADVTISVTIKKIDYTITVAEMQNGTVEAPSTATVGDEVTLTVAPAEGYELETLTCTTEGGEPVEIENYKFTMPAANVTINATFKETVVEYHYSVVEEVKCTVVDASGFASEGQTITMRVVPDSGTQFKEAFVYKVTGHAPDLDQEPIQFTVTPVEGSAKDVDLSFVMPAADVEVHAICATAYSVSVTAGEHGSAQANVIEAYEGETVTVTTYPNAEYKVDEIYYTYVVDGVEQQGELIVGENGVYTFTMPAAPVTVVVTFKTILDYYSLKFDAELEGGTVAVRAEIVGDIESMDKVPAGAGVEVTVTPDEGYEIESFKVVEGITFVPGDDPWGGEFGAPVLKGNGDEVSYTIEDGVYCFPMPNNDATILVSFKQTQYELEGVAFTAERNWATYYNGTKNLALPQGVKAYVVNSVINDAVDITEIDYIPAGVGVLLYSENAAEQVLTTLYTGTTETYTSKLVGSDEAQAITAGYVLYNNNFIRSEEGTVAAHRCYLPATQVAGAPRILKIGYDGDVPTAIETLIAEGNVAKVMYVNMSGLTSDKPFHGINIAVVTFTDGSTKTIKLVK